MSITSGFKSIILPFALTIILTGMFQQVNAQDILRLKSGREIRVSVVEENNDIIRYREFENQSGPVYTIAKDKVESLTYRKGSKPVQKSDTEKPAVKEQEQEHQVMNSSDQLVVKKRYVYLNDIKQNARSIKTIMEDNPEAIRLYESGKTMADLSTACALGVMVTSFAASSKMNKMENHDDRIKTGTIALSIDGAFIITAIILSSSGKKNIRKAVELYNSSLGKPVSYNFNIGLQENGLGIGITF